MLKLVHLNYHFHPEYNTPAAVIEKHRLASGFVTFLNQKTKFISVKHLNYQGYEEIEGIHYRFFRSRNRFWHIPFSTHRFIRREKPDVVLIEGFVFVLQAAFLRWTIGKRCLILAQHHGEKPFTGLKGFLQKRCSSYIDGFLFSGIDNAKPWLSQATIPSNKRCFEVLSASTSFQPIPKQIAKKTTGLCGNANFLWVGRLNANKDPLTVLKAFNRYIQVNPDAKLYFIYQTNDLLPEVCNFIRQSQYLPLAVQLIGEVAHADLPLWYSAADFYITGSHSEGSSYALAEAMACGCIPVVTDIPSLRKMTNDGGLGFLYQKGNAEHLYEQLLVADKSDRCELSEAVKEYSKQHHSYESIANQMLDVISTLKR